jgi:hypothetical protein
MAAYTLEEIQALQFQDLEAANHALRDLLNTYFPFSIRELSIRPLAVSLNSINGFIVTEENRRLFFKTHVEPQSVIDEYYNSSILADAGYPVLRPLHSITEPGKQILLYEVVETPSLFEVLWEVETGHRHNTERIIAAQQQADSDLFKIYLATLRQLSAAEHARAPVHQLFYHRLTRGRFTHFYQGKELALPGQSVPFERLQAMTWQINGSSYADTLGDLVQRAVQVLDPARAGTPSVIGHGDAHNGNLFYDESQGRLFYFDPAFAGRHSPLLDLTKPLFHNVFAIWMYYPHDVARRLSIQCEVSGQTIKVQHNFAPIEIRQALFRSKMWLVLKPLLQELDRRGWLPSDWRTYLKLALFCCPLLTMNLSDQQRFPPPITLLGLCLCMEMGSTGTVGTMLDTELDRIAADLSPPVTP